MRAMGKAAMHQPATGPAARVAALDWPALEAALWEHGHARTGPLLDAGECAALREMFDQDARFRKRIVMERYRYGAGEYAYFAEPLPAQVAGLREAFYGALAPPAGRWNAALGDPAAFPPRLEDWLARCHAAGQRRPTPLLLRYGPGGHNRLHQDRYGALAFPFQVVILLGRPVAAGGDADGHDGSNGPGRPDGPNGSAAFAGGAFLLVENRPREQSRGEAVMPALGEAVIFPNARRPVPGKRGWRAAQVRHGVATVTSGWRHTLGLIFHDAE